jgi:hypothetical protein
MIFLSLKINNLQFSKRGRIIYLTVIERFSQLAAEIAAFVAPLSGGKIMSEYTCDFGNICEMFKRTLKSILIANQEDKPHQIAAICRNTMTKLDKLQKKALEK